MDGGEAWVDGNVVDRGGRAAVGDELHDAGHQSPWRGRHLHRGALGGLGVGLIGRRGPKGEEIGRSPSCKGELVGNDWGGSGRKGERGGLLEGEGGVCGAQQRPGLHL